MALIHKVCSVHYVNCTDKLIRLIRVHFNKHDIMEVKSFFAQRNC